MDLKIIYEDNDVLVVDKPAGLVVFPPTSAQGFGEAKEGKTTENTLINFLLEKYPELKNVGEPPRYGVVHRLDKDTSGIMLIAKNMEALIFLQKQFSAGAKALADRKNRVPIEKSLEKRYIALVTGTIKEDHGTIHTLIGRSNGDPRKQTAHSLEYTGKTGLREAISEYKVIERFKNYTLLDVTIKTGRKHQIRCHLAYIHHPIAGDKLYSFKDSPKPEGLERQFLHSSYLKIKLPVCAGRPSGQMKEFNSEIPQDLEKVIDNLEKKLN